MPARGFFRFKMTAYLIVCSIFDSLRKTSIDVGIDLGQSRRRIDGNGRDQIIINFGERGHLGRYDSGMLKLSILE